MPTSTMRSSSNSLRQSHGRTTARGSIVLSACSRRVIAKARFVPCLRELCDGLKPGDRRALGSAERLLARQHADRTGIDIDFVKRIGIVGLGKMWPAIARNVLCTGTL